MKSVFGENVKMMSFQVNTATSGICSMGWALSLGNSPPAPGICLAFGPCCWSLC